MPGRLMKKAVQVGKIWKVAHTFVIPAEAGIQGFILTY